MQKSFRDFRFVSQFHLAQHMMNGHVLEKESKERKEKKHTLKLCFQATFNKAARVSSGSRCKNDSRITFSFWRLAAVEVPSTVTRIVAMEVTLLNFFFYYYYFRVTEIVMAA